MTRRVRMRTMKRMRMMIGKGMMITRVNGKRRRWRGMRRTKEKKSTIKRRRRDVNKEEEKEAE